MSVVIETTIGDITVDLFLKERPNTCLNFLKLCKIKYYNLCLFHKVERNFIAQSGDPTSTGRGGESVFSHLYGDQAKYFDSELKPRLKHEKMGTLSMVNNGNNMSGSQFFITLGENITYLDEVHTIFGEVVEGIELLTKFNEAICDQNNRPYQDIRITHTVILHDPYDDPSGLEIPDASPVPTREMLETDYIAPDEEIDDTKGKDMEEIEEKIKESEAKARATILEMVGDIPDADVKPPENVLFVCKLNPVTESKDLKVIFSRFGPIVSCEVIKDKKTGESLQYAFIEFEKEEDCENAYFKMDNVLIDDRRIHVDFSQSVSKMNWEQKNKLAKGKSNKGQNLLIKSQTRSDGYEMIFDKNHSEEKPKKKHEKSRDRSAISQEKQRQKYKDSHSHRKINSEKYYDRNRNDEFHKRQNHRYSRSPEEVTLNKTNTSRSAERHTMNKSSTSKLDKRRHRHDSDSASSVSPVRSKDIRKNNSLYHKKSMKIESKRDKDVAHVSNRQAYEKPHHSSRSLQKKARKSTSSSSDSDLSSPERRSSKHLSKLPPPHSKQEKSRHKSRRDDSSSESSSNSPQPKRSKSSCLYKSSRNRSNSPYRDLSPKHAKSARHSSQKNDAKKRHRHSPQGRFDRDSPQRSKNSKKHSTKHRSRKSTSSDSEEEELKKKSHKSKYSDHRKDSKRSRRSSS